MTHYEVLYVWTDRESPPIEFNNCMAHANDSRMLVVVSGNDHRVFNADGWLSLRGTAKT